MKVVTSFLKAGVPICKIDCFRDLLEEGGFFLSDRSNFSQLIPFIHQEEMNQVMKEIHGKHLSVIVDATTHVAEALVIVLRFITND